MYCKKITGLLTNCKSFTTYGGGGLSYPPRSSWFSLNNSKTVKPVTPGMLQHSVIFFRDIRAKFGIHNSPPSPDIGQNPDGSISDFWIFGQSLIK